MSLPPLSHPQMSLTHPSFVLKYGTTPNHIRNSLTNCAVKRPEVNFSLTNKTARKEGLSHRCVAERFREAKTADYSILNFSTHNPRCLLCLIL